MKNSINSKIAIISSAEYFLSRTLTNKLSELSYNTISYAPNNKSLSNLDSELSVIVLFLDSDFSDDMSIMVLIKDFALEKDVPLFLIGRPQELNQAEKIIPPDLIKGVFMRPIDLNEVLSSIVDYLTFFQEEDRKVLLIVDDSGIMLRSAKELFEKRYHVMLANSATMAIKSISLKKPDLILLDYDMPIVDGGQTFEMLRSESDFSSIPIMFLTGINDAETVTSLMKLRPQGYLLKSMSPKELLGAVDDFFLKQKALKRY